MYKILCQVWGGRTGTRSAMLKSEDGSDQEFLTREEAAAEAGRLMAANNSGPRTASFRYTVVEA